MQNIFKEIKKILLIKKRNKNVMAYFTIKARVFLTLMERAYR